MMSKSQKILFDIMGLASVVGLGFASYQIYKLLKKPKSEGGSSSFMGNGKKQIVFTLTNNTNQMQTVYLFDSRSGQNNPNVGVTSNLALFNAELSNDPKSVSKIEFRDIGSSSFSNVEADVPVDETIPSSGGVALVVPVVSPIVTPPSGVAIPVVATPKYNQAEAPFKMNCKDASGNASQQQYTPLISSTQFQAGITTVDMGEAILDGECYMEYTMYPNSKLAIVVYYQDHKLSDLLKKKVEPTSGMKTVENNTKIKRPIDSAASLLAISGGMVLTYKLLQK